MPIIKHIAIHTTPLLSIEYIVNGEKTDEAKFVSGINIPTNANEANDFFRRNFEMFSGERFYKKILDDNKKKEKVRLHHYVQSFSPEENITPEQAHAIGMEWAKRMFGDNYQVIVSTHVDKAHIHNHIAVSAYSLDGKAWHGNAKTLRQCRKVSDEIAVEHGLSIIEKPKHKNTMKYNEWLARQNGMSWKQKAMTKIDELIMRDDVHTIEDLAEKLREENYNVRLGKYMTIRLNSMERGVRTIRFGDGYDLDELKYRIQHKEREVSKAAIALLSGEQKIYALYMRQLQIHVFKHKSPKVTYADLTKSAELLSFLSENNIHSTDELAERVNISDSKYRKVKERCTELEKQISKLQTGDSSELENQLSEEIIIMENLKAERDKVTALYKTYLKHTSENAFEQIMKEVEEEHNYIQQELSKEKNQRNTDNISEEKNL